MTNKQVLELVELYEKNKTVNGLQEEQRVHILKLHDKLIPMDIPLYRKEASNCGSCISKAMQRFVIYKQVLIEKTTNEPKQRKRRQSKKGSI